MTTTAPLTLTDDERLLADAARGYLDDHAPVDQLRRLRDEGEAHGYDAPTWSAMAEMGWAGVAIGEDHGGSGLGVAAAGVIAEEMGRTLTASPFLASAVVGATAIQAADSPAHASAWLPRVAGGQATLTLGVDEGRKHDPAKTALDAAPDGNGFRLNGTKAFVLDGAAADAVVIAARTAGEPGEEGGLTLFLIPHDVAGLEATRVHAVDSRAYATLALNDVRVDADAVLGEVGEGWPVLERALNAGRACLAAEMSGAAQAAFAMTLDYVKQRTQFDRPIASFQALQHRAAHLFTELEIARSAMLKALRQMDEAPGDAALSVSVAKAKMGEVALLAAQEAVQFHGGVGMTDDADVGFFLKRIRAAGAIYGDAEFHADRVARILGY